MTHAVKVCKRKGDNNGQKIASACLTVRGIRNPGVRQYLVFCTADFGPHWPMNQLNKNPNIPNSRIPDASAYGAQFVTSSSFE